MRRLSREKHTGWTQAANCRGLDPDLFYPKRGEPTEPAKEVCRGCTVQAQCLEYALTTPVEREGIWGGLSERERRRLRIARHRAAAAAGKGAA